MNGASFAPGPAAPGSVTTLLGSALAGQMVSASAYPLPTYLGGVSVYVNGVAAPLFYVSPGQIDFQVPYETPLGAGSVVIIADGVTSNVLSLPIAAAAPGIFSGGVLVSALGSSERPVHAGEYITILATGLGVVDTPPASGAALADAQLTHTALSITVTIGGVPATVAFAGLAPPGPFAYTAGVYVVQALVPDLVPAHLAAPSVPVIVSAGGASSNALTVPVAGGAQESYVRFLELGPGTIIARAITSENTCPAVTIDGASQAMSVRAAASLPFYPVLSCELTVPATARSVSIEGQNLPLPVSSPTRITVLGDTGCRMDTSASQGCYDPKAWPVAAINTNAIATNPQLLIHNGDYHYRENPCMGAAACQGSPWGYNWDVWREDLFKPFHDLLAAAPWVFVRGNHESCDRAGEGWFRFLDPRAMPAACPVYTDPYAIDIGAIQLIHIDSAQADDAVLYPDQIAAYTTQFDKLRQMATRPTWMITHRPLWAIRSNLSANAVMQAASNNTLPDTVQTVLSGHTHTFQTYSFSPARAPQMVIGNSGDNLAANPTIPLVGASVGNATVASATSLTGFGFATVTPAGTGIWTVVSKDSNGNTAATCTLQPQRIACDR